MAIKRGNEVSLKGNVDLAEVTLRLKDGEKAKVVLLGTQDYVQFPAHNSFADKIYPQPCLSVNDEECPYCIAYNTGNYPALASKNRIKFAFYEVTSGKVKFWEATNSQAKKLIKQIKEFTEDIEYGTIFEFGRTGTGTETAYTLTPIAERKYTEADRQLLESLKGTTVSDEQFEEVCQPKSRKLVIGLLNEMGVPVRELFTDADAILAEQASEGTESSTTEETDDILF